MTRHEMANTASDLDHALETIRSAHLPHPDGELLECFLQDAIDPEQAARYMLRRAFIGRGSPDVTPLLSDWKQLIAAFAYEDPSHQMRSKGIVAQITRRDGGKCCITGLGNSFWDPLVVVPILPTAKIRVNESLRDMLGAFLGPDLRDWLLSDAVSLDGYRNHWLVRKSAAIAMLQGFFQFTSSKGSEYRVAVVRIGGPEWPSIIEKIPVLRRGCFTDHSTSGMDTPDVSALHILSRFRWLKIVDEVFKQYGDFESELGTERQLWSYCF